MGWGKFFTGAYYGRYDKAVHFFVSAAITAMLLAVVPPLLAVPLAVGVGGLKELYDWLWRGTRVEWADLAVNILGVAVVTGMHLAWVRSAVVLRLLSSG